MNRGEVHRFQVLLLRLAWHRSLIWSAIGRHGSFTPAPAPRRCSVSLALVGVCPRSPGGKCRARPCATGAGGSTFSFPDPEPVPWATLDHLPWP